jgi:hypothetical protein
MLPVAVVSPGFIDVHVHSETRPPRERRESWGSVHPGPSPHPLHTAPDGFGWAPLTPDQKRGTCGARQRFATYGQPDLRPEMADDSSPTRGLRRRHVLIYRWPVKTSSRWRRTRRSASRSSAGDARRHRCGRHRPDGGTHPEWMEAGAVGLNTGLDYQPAANCREPMSRLIALARVAHASIGGHLRHAHMRLQRAGKPDAYRESNHDRPRGCRHPESGLSPGDRSTTRTGAAARPKHRPRRRRSVWHRPCTDLPTPGSSHLAASGSRPKEAERRVRRPPLRRLKRTPSIDDRRVWRHGSEEQIESTAARWRRGILLPKRETGQAHRPPRSLAIASGTRHAGRRDPGSALIIEESPPDALQVFRSPGCSRGRTSKRCFARGSLAHPAFMIASDGILPTETLPPPAWLRAAFAQVLGVTSCADLGALTLERAGPPDESLLPGAERFSAITRIAARSPKGLAADLVVFDPFATPSGHRATWERARSCRRPGIDRVVAQRPGRLVEAGQPTGFPVPASYRARQLWSRLTSDGPLDTAARAAAHSRRCRPRGRHDSFRPAGWRDAGRFRHPELRRP